MMCVDNSTTTIKDLQVVFNLFTGDYPKVSKHTCDEKFLILATNSGVKQVSLNQRVWRERHKSEGAVKDMPVCPACFRNHIYRDCIQLEAEINNEPDGNWGYITLNEKEFQLFRKRLSRKTQSIKYVGYPQGENLIVFHNRIELEDSHSIPTNRVRLYNLVKDAISNMPTGSRSRKSQGFGKGYGTQKVKTSYEYSLIVHDKADYLKFYRENNLKDVDIFSLVVMLTSRCIRFRIMKGHEEILDYMGNEDY